MPTAESSLERWLDYYLAMHATEIDMGLARISQVAAVMGLLDLAPMKVITVGGTNGKGSTCAMLESTLRQVGYRVGVYSSPHITHYNERVRIDGVDASDAAIIAGFIAIEQARGNISLTFFEVATLLGLYLFKQAKIDVAILEVGLGGRLDATNIIDADVAVVTAIDLDHQEYLGETREAIGFEKAGIFKTGKIAITGEPDLPETVLTHAQSLGLTLQRVGHEFSYQRDNKINNLDARPCWHYQGQHWQLKHIPLPKLPLPNAATALAVLEQLFPELLADKGQDAIATGLTCVGLSGRFEIISTEPTIILDVAHNPHAGRYLLSQLQQAPYQGRPLRAVCGMLADKDYASVLTLFTPYVDAWYFTTLESERSASGQALADTLARSLKTTSTKAAEQVQAYDSIAMAWQQLTEDLQSRDVVIVFGSFYTVAGVKALL